MVHHQAYRRGATDTSYTLRAGKEHGLNVEDYELFDLEKVLRQIPYEQQEAHYLDGEETPAEAPAVAAAGGGSGTKEEW